MAICRRLVDELGGEIVVETALGKGTTFRVTLPCSTEPTDPASEAPPAPARPPVRRARILVIDDDELVLNAAHRILAQSHEVVAVPDARVALDRVLGGDTFDIVLCDVLMPEMTGIEFHAALTLRAPEHIERIVFMTGGAFTAAAREFLDVVQRPRLDKPFDAAALLAMVESRLRLSPSVSVI